MDVVGVGRTGYGGVVETGMGAAPNKPRLLKGGRLDQCEPGNSWMVDMRVSSVIERLVNEYVKRRNWQVSVV